MSVHRSFVHLRLIRTLLFVKSLLNICDNFRYQDVLLIMAILKHLSCIRISLNYLICMKFSRNNARVPEYSRGDEGIRTPDPLLAGQVLSQLSYTPRFLGFIRFLTLGSHPILFYIFCLIYVVL